MGIFDKIKSALSGEIPAPKLESVPKKIKGERQSELIKQLVEYYRLEKKRSFEPSIAGSAFPDWWQASYRQEFIAIRDPGSYPMEIYLGEVEECTEIYLGRVSAENPLPRENSPQRLDRIVRSGGRELAAQFFLWAIPQGEFDFPVLRDPAFRDGLPKLSPSVYEVGAFSKGVQLSLRSELASLDSVNADVNLALEMVKALKKI